MAISSFSPANTRSPMDGLWNGLDTAASAATAYFNSIVDGAGDILNTFGNIGRTIVTFVGYDLWVMGLDLAMTEIGIVNPNFKWEAMSSLGQESEDQLADGKPCCKSVVNLGSRF